MLFKIVFTIVSFALLYGLWRYRHDGPKMKWMINIVFIWIVISSLPELLAHGEPIWFLAVSGGLALGIGWLIAHFFFHQRT